METIPNIGEMLFRKLLEIEEKVDMLSRAILNSQTDVGPSSTYDVFLTVSETAKFIDCSKPYVYDLKHKIPHVIRGARLYFKKSDLIDYMNKGRVVPKKKTANE